MQESDIPGSVAGQMVDAGVGGDFVDGTAVGGDLVGGKRVGGAFVGGIGVGATTSVVANEVGGAIVA
jgi:hypothetical protein